MKRLVLSALGVLLSLYLAAVIFSAKSSDPVPTPTHVVAVYVDGLNHLDFRETCSTIHAPHVFPTQKVCEGYFAFNTAVGGSFTYTVVAHSVKVWTQKFGGRDVRLAVVKYRNTSGGYPLTAHLRFINGAWWIVGVS